MTTEYRIRFEAGGLTITQTTTPSTPQEVEQQNKSATVTAAHELGNVLRAGEGGGGTARTESVR